MKRLFLGIIFGLSLLGAPSLVMSYRLPPFLILHGPEDSSLLPYAGVVLDFEKGTLILPSEDLSRKAKKLKKKMKAPAVYIFMLVDRYNKEEADKWLEGVLKDNLFLNFVDGIYLQYTISPRAQKESAHSWIKKIADRLHSQGLALIFAGPSDARVAYRRYNITYPGIAPFVDAFILIGNPQRAREYPQWIGKRVREVKTITGRPTYVLLNLSHRNFLISQWENIWKAIRKEGADGVCINLFNATPESREWASSLLRKGGF